VVFGRKLGAKKKLSREDGKKKKTHEPERLLNKGEKKNGGGTPGGVKKQCKNAISEWRTQKG